MIALLEDTQGHKIELRYIKDVDRREVDFVIIQNKKPIFAVEVKTGDKHISKHLYYYRERTNILIYIKFFRFFIKFHDEYIKCEALVNLPLRGKFV